MWFKDALARFRSKYDWKKLLEGLEGKQERLAKEVGRIEKDLARLERELQRIYMKASSVRGAVTVSKTEPKCYLCGRSYKEVMLIRVVVKHGSGWRDDLVCLDCLGRLLGATLQVGGNYEKREWWEGESR